MTIKLTVTWANAGHALLPDALAEIGVQVDRWRRHESILTPTSRPGMLTG